MSVIRRRRPGRAAILAYHRVELVQQDPWLLAVEPARFSEHLEVLASGYRVFPLGELLARQEDGRLPDRALAVTFDDGYRDNFARAKPMLERVGVPATVFVVTGFLDSGRDFWWDELAELCLDEDGLPLEGEVEVGGFRCAWRYDHLARAADGLGEVDEWAAWHPPRTPRESLHARLASGVKSLRHLERLQVLDALRRLTDLSPPSVPNTLTSGELAELSGNGLIGIGAHTATHPSLPRLPQSAQIDELRSSKERLEVVAGRPIGHFSYPYGELDEQTPGLVRDAGFDSGLTMEEALVTRGRAPYAMPRLRVGNWPGAALERRLHEWGFDG